MDEFFGSHEGFSFAPPLALLFNHTAELGLVQRF
jgi:hypothetical protein